MKIIVPLRLCMAVIPTIGFCLAVILATSRDALAKSLVKLEEPLKSNVSVLPENYGEGDWELGRGNLNIITNQKLNDEVDHGKDACNGFIYKTL